MKSLFGEKVARIKEERERERKIREIELEKRKEQFLKPAIHAKKLLEKLIAEDEEFLNYLLEQIYMNSWETLGISYIVLDKWSNHKWNDCCLSLVAYENQHRIELTWHEDAVLEGANHKTIRKLQTKEGIIEFLVNKLGVQ